MKILQIVESIHGEFPRMGYPVTILRLAGCNLECKYCDAPEGAAEDMTLDAIKHEIAKLNNDDLLVTGGEPLLQWKELYPLLKDIRMKYNIVIETNGAVKLTKELRTCVDHIVMDVKLYDLPKDLNCLEYNLPFLGTNDVIKFVYEDREQFDKAWQVALKIQHSFLGTTIFSPVNKEDAFVNDFIQRCKKHPGEVRMQIQIHKYLGTE